MTVRHYAPLLTMLLVSCLPLLAAIALQGGGAGTEARLNRGVLLEVDTAALGASYTVTDRPWSVLALADGPCPGAPCAALVDGLARARVALGRDAGRIGLLLITDVPTATAGVDRVLPSSDALRARLPVAAGGALVLDHAGRPVLAYPPGPDLPRAVLADLRRLVRAGGHPR